MKKKLYYVQTAKIVNRHIQQSAKIVFMGQNFNALLIFSKISHSNMLILFTRLHKKNYVPMDPVKKMTKN